MPKPTMTPTYALLGLLYRGARHGYELKRTVDQDWAPYWRIDFAQLYRSLAKMTRAGWVSVATSASARGPQRKTYTLTAKGRQAFQNWLAQPPTDRNELFVKLRLAGECGLSVAHLVEPVRQSLETERAQHLQAHQRAQADANLSRLVVAHAALRETEASLNALDLYTTMMPQKKSIARTAPQSIVITGSDDPLLARLAQLAHISTHPVGSIGGLLALAQHQANIAGVHLRDADTGEYNIPFIKHLLPEDEIVLINLAFRENGLIVARENPLNIRGVRDLIRQDIRFINRARGTGTRLWLFSKLRAARIDPHTLPNWERTVTTHDAVAAAIATGAADVGPGLRATAVEWHLDFIPLGEERYDLAMPRAAFESAPIEQLLAKLQSKEFRATAHMLAGYDVSKCGRVMARIK